MSEEQKGTTVFLDQDMIAEADAIAEHLKVLVGGKMSRTAVVRRAVHDLFLSICLSKKPDDSPSCEKAAA
jgi:hypothetical protein